ncbi:unnamed protein product [Anisakis simplex]|uniref:Uncharacterized protein n=1 Tax=Anisakis simplex TaxID=6269 RepID=A0A0M3K374_ANISI|nr:unnamed protein product [Anisakis simplex]
MWRPMQKERACQGTLTDANESAEQICMQTWRPMEQKRTHRELITEIDESREPDQISSKPPLWHNVKAIKLLQISTNHDNQTTEL